MFSYIFMPGIGNSEPDHWQSRWENEFPASFRVNPPSWDYPIRSEWTNAIVRTANEVPGDKIVIAHSLGCLTVAEAADALAASGVLCAFLVAVPDAGAPSFPSCAKGFRPADSLRMSLRTLIVGSTNDPYSEYSHIKSTAEAWQCKLVCAGALGHINLASGVGDWPQGKKILAEFVADVLGDAGFPQQRSQR